MSIEIHSTAIVHPEAKLGENCSVGPFSIIGANVSLGNECKVHSNVVLDGHLRVGNNNEFFQFCSIGAPPQDLTYQNEPTEVEIGDNNVFREYVSIHRGTMKDRKLTTIGSNCLLMAHVHIGHDAIVGNNCVFANSVNLAGHVKIGERAIIGGGTQVSQFVSIGRGAYIGGAAAIDRDIPLFCTSYGNRAKLKGINIIGMRRQGHEKQIITEVVDFYRFMESSALSPRAFCENDELMSDFKGNDVVEEMAQMIKDSKIGIAPFMT